MGLGFWILMLLLTPVTGGLNWVLYIMYWFAKKVGRYVIWLYVFPIKVTIAILELIWKAISTLVGGTAHSVEDFYKAGKNNAVKYPRGVPEDSFREKIPFFGKYKFTYVAVFLLFLYLDYQFFLSSAIQDPSLLIPTGGIGGFLDTIPFVLLGVVFPFLLTFLVSAVVALITGNFDKAKKAKDALKDAGPAAPGVGAASAAAGAAAGAKQKTGQAASAAGSAAKGGKDAAESGLVMASHIDTAKGAVEAGAEEGILADVLGTVGMEGLVSSIGGSIVASGGTILIVFAVLLILWILSTLLAFAIAVAIAGMLWGYISMVIPLIAGPAMAALGLGEAYGQWFGQSTANTIGPQLEGAFEEERRMLAQMGAKMGCALEGPQCLRQWRMNNTVRPGSESVGETYELRIDRFQLAQDQVDVAYKEKNFPLPISFLVYNTRHGLKGITARDVRYRITVEDSSHQGDNAYCSTGWTSINTSTGDFILPGLGVSPRETLQQINLADCGLLQPSMGVNRVLSMDLEYDYSSQTTLYFDAMSRQHRREQGMTPDFTKSETAKTPVQSYINVRSPVTYFETEGGDRRPVPFAARFGFETPGFSVDYHVDPDSIEIQDSVMTKHTDNCQGLGDLDDDNEYVISDRSEERIEDRQAESWFNKNIGPSPLRCTFELTDQAVETINPTGEELIMRMDANYTLRRQEQHSSFSMVNTRCTRSNCPLLVTERYNETHEGLMFSECDYGTSVDSYGGCAVLKPDKSASFRSDSTGVGTQSGDIDWTSREIVEGVEIRQGQTAVDWSYRKSELKDQGAKGKHFIESPKADITGVEEDILDKMDGDKNTAVLSRPRGSKSTKDIEYVYCKENDETFEDFALAFKSRQNAEKIFYFSAEAKKCKDDGDLLDAIANFFDGQPTYSKFESRCDNRAGDRTAIVVSNGNSLECYYGFN